MYQSESIDVQYLGFHPSEWAKVYLRDALATLQNQLPSGARLRAVIKRQNNMLVAHVDILSRSGRLFIPAQATRLSQLCGQLEDRVHRQITKWRDQQRRRRTS